LVSQDPPSQGCEGSQREDLLPVPRHVSSVSRHPDDETSANAFKCGRRLVTRPAQGDAHLQFESAVNIEILEFTPTNLASHSGRAQSPSRQYYVCMIWDNFHSRRFSSVLSRTATIHAERTIEKLADHSNDSGDAQEGDTIKRRKKVDRKKGRKEKEPQRSGFKVSGTKWPAEGVGIACSAARTKNTPSADFRSKSSWTIKSSLNQKEDIKDKRLSINNCVTDFASVPNGSVYAWEGRILVTQFASAIAAATVAASLAADANFLHMSEQVREGEGQGRKIRKSRDRTEHFPKGRKEPMENGISRAFKKCIQISPGVTKPKYNGDKSSLAVCPKSESRYRAYMSRA
ncbi:hypothetical protein ALC57_09594, partial [Trachymyrmex cornetzi]